MNFHSESGPDNAASIARSLSSVSGKTVVALIGACVLFSAAVFTFTYGLEFLKLIQTVAEKFDLYCPEISIVAGEATIREKQPYLVQLPEGVNFNIVIDTRKDPKPNPLSQLNENSPGLALLRNSLILKNGQETSKINLDKFPDLTINSQTLKAAVNNNKTTILVFLGMASLIYYGISKIVQTILCSVAILLVTRYSSIPFNFGKSFKLASFIILPATLVDLILRSLDILNSSQLYIYLSCYAGVMFWLVKDLITDSSWQNTPE
ncbi:MAG: DUF1189 family protein [Desulfomonilaceae bacterium]